MIQNNIFIVQWVISPCIFDWNRFNFHQTLSRPWQKYKVQTHSLDQKAYKFQKCHYIEVLIRIRYFKAKYSKYLTYLRVTNRCNIIYTLFKYWKKNKICWYFNFTVSYLIFVNSFWHKLQMCGGRSWRVKSLTINLQRVTSWTSLWIFHIQSGLLFPVICLNWVKSLSRSIRFDLEVVKW